TKSDSDLLRDSVVRAIQTSICGGCCYTTAELSVVELRSWQRNPEAENAVGEKVDRMLKRMMTPFDLAEWTVGNPLDLRLRHGRGAEAPVPTFYLSFGLQRLLLTVCAEDLESKDSSVLWAATWHVLLMAGISALLEMLGTFHHEIEHRSSASSAQAFLREFIVDLEEYFDFELLPAYRLDFDALKRVEGIDDDFKRLQERIAVLSQDRIIEET